MPIKKQKIEKIENIHKPDAIYSGHESIFGRLERSVNPQEDRVIVVPTYSEKAISTQDLEETPELELRRLTSIEKINPDKIRKTLLSSKLLAEKKYASNYIGESLNIKKRKFYEKLNTVINSPQKRPYGTLKPVLANDNKNDVGNKVVIRNEEAFLKNNEKNILDLGYKPVRHSENFDLSQTTRFELPGVNKEVVLGKKEGNVDGNLTPLFGMGDRVASAFGTQADKASKQVVESEQKDNNKRRKNGDEDAPKPNFGNKGDEGVFGMNKESSLFSNISSSGSLFTQNTSASFGQTSTNIFSQSTPSQPSLFNKPETASSNPATKEPLPSDSSKQSLFTQPSSSTTGSTLFAPSVTSNPQNSLFGSNQTGLFSKSSPITPNADEKKPEVPASEPKKDQTSLFGSSATINSSAALKEPVNTTNIFGQGEVIKPASQTTGNLPTENKSLFGNSDAKSSVFGFSAGTTNSGGLFGSKTGENSQSADTSEKKGLFAPTNGSLFASNNAGSGSLFGSNSAGSGSLFGSNSAGTSSLFGSIAANSNNLGISDKKGVEDNKKGTSNTNVNSVSLFTMGSNISNTNNSIFGGSGGSSLFGNTGFGNATSGSSTAPKSDGVNSTSTDKNSSQPFGIGFANSSFQSSNPIPSLVQNKTS